jgi:hypothetical protein
MKYPAELYTASPRPYDDIPESHYRFHDRTVIVTSLRPPVPLSQEDQSQHFPR